MDDLVLDEFAVRTKHRLRSADPSMRITGENASREPSHEPNRGDAEDDDRDEDLDQRFTRVVAAGDSTDHGWTWWKMPYIADTRAMATKPTTIPTNRMTVGSNRLVKRLIL